MRGQKGIAQQDGGEVQSLLKESGLLKVLKKYGNASIVRSHPADKTTDGGIDIQLVSNPRNRKKIPEIFEKIQNSTKFASYYLGDWGNAEESSLGGYQVIMDKFSETGKWKVSVWIIFSESKKKNVLPSKFSDAAIRLISNLGISNISIIPLYIFYVLLIIAIFLLTLGSLNRNYNNEWGFKKFLKETEPTEIIESINEEVDEEMSVEEPVEEHAPADSEQNHGQTSGEAKEAPEEAQSTDPGGVPITIPDMPLLFPDISTPIKTYEGGSRDFVDPELEELEEVSINVPEEVSQTCAFSRSLRYRQQGDDIVQLQLFLKKQGWEIYPEGILSGLFGPLTYHAVVRFQEKFPEEILAPWDIEEGTGFVGSTTRKKIKELCVPG